MSFPRVCWSFHFLSRVPLKIRPYDVERDLRFGLLHKLLHISKSLISVARILWLLLSSDIRPLVPNREDAMFEKGESFPLSYIKY